MTLMLVRNLTTNTRIGFPTDCKLHRCFLYVTQCSSAPTIVLRHGERAPGEGVIRILRLKTNHNTNGMMLAIVLHPPLWRLYAGVITWCWSANDQLPSWRESCNSQIDLQLLYAPGGLANFSYRLQLFGWLLSHSIDRVRIVASVHKIASPSQASQLICFTMWL